MSVIVKGMEMPMLCGSCFLRGSCEQRIYMERRPKDCPLVEVKEPHGRLIDADKLARETIYNPLSAPYITEQMLLNAPTVIESEGGEE